MLKIVSNNSVNEVHSVFIDDGAITIVDINSGDNVTHSEMNELFPNFADVIQKSSSTEEVITNLSLLNEGYIWAHVSGKFIS